ncbi:uncharacterized protein V6R79_009918 [Siganus canaliculatus]
MAFIERWSLFQDKALICLLLVLLSGHTATGMSGWGGCLDGQDVYGSIKENSLLGEVVAELMVETTMDGIQWRLDGKDAHWFFLDNNNIRLNASADKVLDREAEGPLLLADLLCFEDNTLQTTYRVLVEILNENDNLPAFADDTVLSLIISELTPVDTVVFTVQAKDADEDKIIYSIDQSSPDAKYFKIDLPNSGKVVLSKPLDYETKTLLTVTIHAAEMNTAEHFNTSTNITITVLDGDDQYPQFLPCTLLFQDETSHICTSPVYTVNVTEGEEDMVLNFSPGPIHAVDGDKAISSQVNYAILSGDDDGRFLIDRATGEMKLIQGVTDRLITPVLRLQVMAYQDDDPRKYSVATVLVQVLGVNNYLPEFDKAEYRGFVIAGNSPASLVNTYGSKALMLHVKDQDFSHSFNPRIHFTFSPASNHTDIYQITQEGLLITRTNQLKPTQKHVLAVMAVDQESGDAAFTTVVVEVLPEGQSIPLNPLGDDRLIGCTVGKALFLSMVFTTVIGCILSLGMWLKRKQKGKRNPLERGCVAQGKHPNVSLRWFQLLSHRNVEEVPHKKEEYGTCNPSFSFSDTPGLYTHQDLPPCPGPVPPTTATVPSIGSIPAETVRSPVLLNNTSPPPTKTYSSSPTFHSTAAEMSPRHLTQDAAAFKDNSGSSTHSNSSPQPTEPLSNSSPHSVAHGGLNTPPVTCPDPITDRAPDPVTSPSSQSSIPCSHTRIATAEIDKPLCKSRVKTPPSSPPQASPLPKQTDTPPLSPDHAPLKVKLVHIDTSPLDTPRTTPEPTSVSLNLEASEPSTSLDQIDPPEHPDEDKDPECPPQDRRPSTNSGTTQDMRETRDVDEDGFLGDEDADKNSEDEDELEPDEEELLRVLARCNPTFITFSRSK